MAPAVRIRPLPAMISVDGPMTRPGSTPSIVSGLPALPRATMRPSRMPTSALTTPQWSRTTAPVMTVSGAPSARVARALAHRLPDDLAAAEHGLVAAARPPQRSSVDLDEQVGVGQPDPVAGGRAVQRGVAGPGRASAIELAGAGRHRRAHRRPRRGDRDDATAAEATSATSRSMPGSKRTAVPAGTARRRPQAAARSKSSAGLASAKW